MLRQQQVKFVLISLYEEIHSYGVRSLAAFLKSKGVHVTLIFCPVQSRYSAYLFHKTGKLLPPKVADHISESNATCIGISLMTDHFSVAASLTKELKQRLPKTPIIWGGVHPTLLPEDCTVFADYVCVGEGYESTYELLNCLSEGILYPKIPGICYRREGDFIFNELRQLISNIDALPFVDYGLDDHYLRIGNSVVPMTTSLMKRYLGEWYTSFFSYGCPYSCTYCCNSFFHSMHPGYKKIRKHSPEYISEEIKSIRKMHPFIRMVKFNDDSFLSLSESEIDSFRRLQVGNGKTAFVATGFNPNLVTENKVDMLVEAGLRRTRIGIQTGCRKILNDIYKRKTTNDNIIRSSKILSKYSKQLVPTAYDIILDNPWENPEDTVDTFRLICQLERPFSLNLFSLRFYPRTALYDKALNEGILELKEKSGGKQESYGALKNTYLNCLITASGIIPIPAFMQKHLISKRFINNNPKVPKQILTVFGIMTKIKKVYHHMSKGDVTMLPYFLSRII